MFTVPTQLADGVLVASKREDSVEANTILHLFWRQTIKIGLARSSALGRGETGSIAKALSKETQLLLLLISLFMYLCIYLLFSTIPLCRLTFLFCRYIPSPFPFSPPAISPHIINSPLVTVTSLNFSYLSDS